MNTLEKSNELFRGFIHQFTSEDAQWIGMGEAPKINVGGYPMDLIGN